jgi:DNA-binding beta-propeller fold protein YncE
MLRRLVATALVGTATLVAGCSTGGQPTDDLMVTDAPVAATPALSPPVAAAPAGTALAVAGQPVAMAVDTTNRLLAVAVDAPPSVLLYPLDDLNTAPRSVPLPAAAEDLRLAADGGPLLAAAGGQVVRIALPTGEVATAAVAGAPVSAAQFDDHTLVAVRDRREVAVLDGGTVRRVISGNMFSADRVLATDRGAVVLDRLRNAVFELDVAGAAVKQGLRAGDGSTNAAVDRFGRVLVVDTRGGALLAFSLDPLLLRQRYPITGAPFGIAYDPSRDLAWVTLTATNQVVGYQVAGEEPTERYRFPTVGQPNTVTVDPGSGRVFVASANGGGIQVIAT